MHPHELPVPDAAALAASATVAARIRDAIDAAGGWIGFDRYMDLALHAPGLGYYAAGARRFGAGGDFVTAPELGPLFARTLARQVAELFRSAPPAVLELGAGSGALAEALLDELAVLGAPAASYAILETSAALRARQRERLGTRVQWLDALPASFAGVVVANEVADAIPVRAVAWTDGGLLERGVTVAGDGFAWADRTAPADLAAAARALEIEPPRGGRYESEIGLAGKAWMASLAAMLSHGAILVVDYGFPRREYYHPQRHMGTLMCHYRHRAHADPFVLPGLQDITSHVDFTAMAWAAHHAGMEVLGYTSQATFLVNCGITDLLARVGPDDPARYLPLTNQANRLLSPAEMGELFKAIAFGRGLDTPLVGFENGGRSHTL